MTDSRRLNAQARQERIKELLAQELSVSEIAKAVGASKRTVDNDIKMICEETAAARSPSSARGLAATMLNRSNFRQRDLGSLYDEADGSELSPAESIKLRLDLLTALGREDSKEVDLLVNLGVVDPDAQSGFVPKSILLLNALPPWVSEDILVPLPPHGIRALVRRINSPTPRSLLHCQRT